ncbi:MAG: M56 family metallopeptidase [Phycisphaerales bacterium]
MNAIVEAINLAGRMFIEFSLPMLIQSSVLILILLAVDTVLRRRVRAVFRYCIWMLVLVKLVLPPSLGSPVSVGTWFGDKLEVPSASLFEPESLQPAEPHATELPFVVSAILAPPDPRIARTPVPPTPAMPSEAQPPAAPETHTSVRPAAVSLNWQGLTLLAWLAVVIALTLLLVQRAFFVRGLVAQAEEANHSLLDEMEDCRRRLGLRRQIGLRLSPNASSPAVCGLLRPVILIPQTLAPRLHSHDLTAVFLHELAHVRRGDLWINLAQTLLQIAYFYNPLLWLANAMIRRTREQAVDEAVLVAMGETARQYPETLVNIAKLAFTRRPALSLRLIGVVESKSALTGRIKHILNRPLPRTAKLGVLGLLVVLLLAAILLPMAKARPFDERADSTDSSASEEPKELNHAGVVTLPDSDGDGLTDFQETHKYLTDPAKKDSDGDGTPDGDWNERREYAYSVRTVLRYMPPCDEDGLNDDFQDARVLAKTDEYIEVEVIHYPLATSHESVAENRNWRRDYAHMTEFLAPDVTTNWDDAMRLDLLAALKADGIDIEMLSDKQVVEQVSSWLMNRSRSLDKVFTTYYIHFPRGKPEVLPGLEDAFRREFERDSANYDWTIAQHFDHEVLGKGMFYNKTHGSCTSTAVYLTTVLRALRIPTRMVLATPAVDASDREQILMVKKALTHNKVRETVLAGLRRSSHGFTNHTFNEVYVGGRWQRLDYARLGCPAFGVDRFGLQTHLYTINDLSDVDFAPTWGWRYAKGDRSGFFKHDNPYSAVEVSELFGPHGIIPNPAFSAQDLSSNPLPDVFLYSPRNAAVWDDFVKKVEGSTWNKTGRPHEKEYYDNIFEGVWATKPGDILVLLFSLDTPERIPEGYESLLPKPWPEIESQLRQGRTVELAGKAREMNLILLAAPTVDGLKSLVRSSSLLSVLGKPTDSGGAPAGPVTVELIGVCEHPSEGKQWWRADGSLMDRAPYKTTDSKREQEAGFKDYELVVRYSGASDISIEWDVPGSRNNSHTGSPLGEDDRRIRDLTVSTVRFPDSQTVATVRVAAAGGPWETRAIHKTLDREGAYNLDDDKIVTFGIAHMQDRRLLVPVTINLSSHDRASRVVAVRGRDEECEGSVSGAGDNSAHSLTYRFDCSLSDVKEFRFQTRPWTWFEFKDVSLRPGQKANAGSAARARARVLGIGPAWEILSSSVGKRSGGTIGGFGRDERQSTRYFEETLDRARPGDALVLMFAFDRARVVPAQFHDLLLAPWSEIESRVQRGESVEIRGKARDLDVIVLAAATSEQLDALVRKTPLLDAYRGGDLKEIVLPEAGKQPVILDLATGELVSLPPVGPEPQKTQQALRELGKGDIVYDVDLGDRSLILLRGAVSEQVQEDTGEPGIKGHLVGENLPEVLTVTTAEGRRYEVTILSADDQGCTLKYSPTLIDKGAGGGAPVESAEPEATTATKPSDSGLVARLANGVTIELLAYSRLGEGGLEWWTPQGERTTVPGVYEADVEGHGALLALRIEPEPEYVLAWSYQPPDLRRDLKIWRMDGGNTWLAALGQERNYVNVEVYARVKDPPVVQSVSVKQKDDQGVIQIGAYGSRITELKAIDSDTSRVGMSSMAGGPRVAAVLDTSDRIHPVRYRQAVVVPADGRGTQEFCRYEADVPLDDLAGIAIEGIAARGGSVKFRNILLTGGQPAQIRIEIAPEDAPMWFGSNLFSALTELGTALSTYAGSHASRYPADESTLRTLCSDRLWQWLQEHVVYLGAGKTSTGPAQTALAYVKTLLPFGFGTYVLYSDGNVEFVVPSKLKELGITAESSEISVEARSSTTLVWRRTDRYVAPDPNGFFPDDPEGGRRLDVLFQAADKDQRSDEEILAAVRQGLRTAQHRQSILEWIGERYIWNRDPQHPQAIEIMYHAAPLEPHWAVYAGLAVVRNKPANLLRTLADLCMQGEDVGRIIWGIGDQREQLLSYITAYLQDKDPAKQEVAAALLKHVKGELDFDDWLRGYRVRQGQIKYGRQLAQFKETLLTGGSEARYEILNTIGHGRKWIEILNDSFLPVLQTVGADPDHRVRTQVANVAGYRWIWSAKQQDPNAIELMLRLSSDTDRDVRHNAVYYGLSVVRDKGEPVVRRLVDLVLADQEQDFYGRVVWGLKNSVQRSRQLVERVLISKLEDAETEPERAAVRRLYNDVLGQDAPATPGVSGRVVDPNSEPVAGAQVALCTKDKGVIIRAGQLAPTTRDDKAGEIVKTDAEGRFSFASAPEEFHLIAARDEGFAWVTNEELRASTDLRLEPWARIEGTLKIGQALGEDQRVELFNYINKNAIDQNVRFDYQSQTDAAGRFVFTKVPPTWMEVGYLIQTGDPSWSHTCRTPIHLEPGQNMQMTLGGQGRPVIGRFVPPADYKGSAYFGAGLRAFSTSRPERPQPDNYDQMTQRERAEWLKQWLKTPDAQAYYDAIWHDLNRRHYTFRIQDDGSFRIEDVMPGTYEFTVWLEEQFTGQGRQEEIGGYYGTAQVPAMMQTYTAEPLDLGDLALSMRNPPLHVGDVAPLFEVKTLDGKDLRLVDYHGKFVLLSFWQPVFHPELDRLKELYKTYGAEGRLAIIEFAGNDTLEEVRKYIAERKIEWPEVYLGEKRDSDIAKRYGDAVASYIVLVDPEGKIVATWLREENLTNTVRDTIVAEDSEKKPPSSPTSIQQRIDAAVPGDTIRLEPGTYHERLSIDKPLTLEGAGWDKTTVMMESQVPESKEQSADLAALSVLNVVGAKDVTIRGVKFTSPGRRVEGRSLPMAIVTFSRSEVRLSDCAVIGGPGDGVHIIDQSNAAFQRCLVAAVWGTGIRVGSGKDVSEARIEDSDIRNCHYAGIRIARDSKAAIERCRVSGAAWHGIRYDDASPLISGNLIFGSARFGIYASGRTAATVTGNLFYANEMGGMSCWFQDKDLIEGNTFANNKGPGLAILGASKPSVRSNIFDANPAGVSIGDIGDDSPFAKSDGSASLENNLFWANERAIQRTSGAGAAEAVALDEKAGVSLDPGFAAPQARDFSLKADSPARQKGVGVADLIPFASPWSLQPEELAIIPQGDTRDYQQWRDPPLP